MKRGRKPGHLVNQRDERGWMVPREGTVRRAVYEALCAGQSRTVILAMLGLTDDQYRVHLARITQGPRAVKASNAGSVRPCLNCKRPFESEWIGNRLCPACAGWGGVAVTPGFNRDSDKAGAV